MVVEATGGLERALTVALEQAGIAVAVVNPRQIRDFARARRRAGENRPARCLRAGALRRAHAPGAAPAARGGRPRAGGAGAAPAPARAAGRGRAQPRPAHRGARGAGLDRGHLGWLKTALAELEDQIDARLASNPVWQERAALLAVRAGRRQGHGEHAAGVCCPSSASSTAAPSPRWSGSRRSRATAA